MLRRARVCWTDWGGKSCGCEFGDIAEKRKEVASSLEGPGVDAHIARDDNLGGREDDGKTHREKAVTPPLYPSRGLKWSAGSRLLTECL